MSLTPPSALMRQARKIGPLALIILLHIGFFWALQSGLVKQVSTAVVPKEVIATFIVPEKAPEPAPPKAEPAPPKQVKIVKKVVAPPKPIPVTETPAPTAITAPPQPPQPATPAPQVAAEPTPAPAAPPGPVLPKQITSGIEYIEKPNPTYPSVSRRMGEEGVVEFRVTVNTSGRAEKVEITKSSGYARLDDAARSAVMRAVFKPYIENGRAIMVSTVGSLAFRLN